MRFSSPCSTLNFCPPFRLANISSIRGSGYLSTSRTALTVVLKSPHTRTDPSGFPGVTIGAAQSLYGTARITPSLLSFSSASSTLARRERGTDRALIHRGVLPALTAIFALMPFSFPNSGENAASCRCKTSFTGSSTAFYSLNSDQFSLIFRSQFRPNNGCPEAGNT